MERTGSCATLGKESPAAAASLEAMQSLGASVVCAVLAFHLVRSWRVRSGLVMGLPVSAFSRLAKSRVALGVCAPSPLRTGLFEEPKGLVLPSAARVEQVVPVVETRRVAARSALPVVVWECFVSIVLARLDNAGAVRTVVYTSVSRVCK